MTDLFMKTSQNGINFIKAHEGFRSKPYNDGAGFSTVGYGHKIKTGEAFTEISEAQAEVILAGDLVDEEEAINNLVTVPLTQNQFDALVSFAFNVGVGNFSKSHLLSALNIGDYPGAAGQFSRWIFANHVTMGGLVTRRNDEAELFRR